MTRSRIGIASLALFALGTEAKFTSSCAGGWLFGNPKLACPQHLCYGDSVCCMGTGECLSCPDPSSSICKKAHECDSSSSDACGDTATGWPSTTGDHATKHDSAHHIVDGCVCRPPSWSPCHKSKMKKSKKHRLHFRDHLSPDCWGALQCEAGDSGSCNVDGLCRGTGGLVASEGDLCWFKGNSHNSKNFKFCGGPEPASTTTTTTQVNTDLICDMNCYHPAAEPVLLKGSIGSGDTAYVPMLTEQQCIDACQAEPTCEAVVYDTIGLACYGRKHLTTADTGGGCQYQPGFITITMAGRPAPWGKCTVLGDPHITTFDSMTLAGGYTNYHRVINIYDAGLFGLVTSNDITIQGRFGFSKEYTQASSLLGVAMTGSLIGGETLAVGMMTPDSVPEYAGWAVYYGNKRILTSPGTWTSADNLVSVSLERFDPDDFCSKCRAPVSTEETPFAYVIELGRPYNVQVYLLPGKFISNSVVTMRRVVGQEGLCGNFNCDKSDDSAEQIIGNPAYPYTDGIDLFPAQLIPPKGWDVETGKSREKAVADCPEHVKVATCGGRDGTDEWDACAFDICIAYADNPLLRGATGLGETDALSKAWMGLQRSGSWLSAPMLMVAMGSCAALGFAVFSRRQLGRAPALRQSDTLLASEE